MLESLSDAALNEREAMLRRQVDRGLDNGCREYLLAVVCEQGQRAIRDARAIIDRLAA